MAFHGLTAAGAQGLTARVFGPSITSAGANPATTVARAGTVVRYLSDYRAIVRKPDGRLELEVSTVPLAVLGGGHAKLPVSLDLQRLGSGFATVRSAQPVSIAGSSGGGVGLSSQGVRLVVQGASVRGSLVGDKSVFFANVGRDEDASAVPTIQGVELFDILRSKLSPEQLRYRVVMPRGAELQAVGGGASVVLGGRELAHVPAPSARDAQGQVVPVRMAVSGDELRLTIARRGLDVAYPLLVDPELGGSKPPGWKYYTNDSAIEGIHPAAISAGGEFGKHDWGAWLWSRPNEASFIKSLVYYGLSYSETNLTSWWAAVGSGTVYKGEHGELITNFTWWWGESSPSSPPAEVVVNKMAGGPEQSAVVVGLESTPHPTETEKGSASFSVSAILATIELNGATTTSNPLGEPSTTLTPEEGYGLEDPGAPNFNHKCMLGWPVDCATGNQVESQTDIAIGGRGLGLKLTRTYNSQLATKMTSPGSFGYGWTGPYSAHMTFGKFCNESSCVETATVHQDDGSTVQFELASNGTYVAGSWVQATLVKEGSSYIYTLPNQSTLHFNSTGELTSEADQANNTTTINHDSEGRIESVKDPSGRKLTFAYNSNGEVESVTDPMSNVVKYEYEGGNLVSVTEPGETKPRWRFKYDASHQLTEETDGLGHTATSEYDAEHRVISQKDPLEHIRQWKYGVTEAGTETRITEPNGSTTVEQFNGAGLPTSVTHAWGTSLAATTTYEYDSAYNLVAVADPNLHQTKYTYDARDNRVGETDALGHKTEWVYNGSHEITRETNPDGEATHYARNLFGEPTEISRAAPGKQEQVTHYFYNESDGMLEHMTDPMGRKSRYEYDTYGDLEEEVDPEGDIRRWGYNEDSQETSYVSPRGNLEGSGEENYVTSIERDAQGRPVHVTDPLEHSTEYVYNADGDLESQTDGNGNRTKYVYNADDEPIKIEEPDGAVTETGYDNEGQITSQTDGNGHTTKYARNALERIVEVGDPLGRKTFEGIRCCREPHETD